MFRSSFRSTSGRS